jgi:hypothetical protein
MNTQPEALRLAKALEFYTNHFEKTKHEDHELLKLAAEAANYDYEIRKEVNPYSMRFEHNFYLRNKIYWNPFENDGDALRLAVKLWLTIDCHLSFVVVRRQDVQKEIVVHQKHDNNDPYAATRRAIVRAAAEIGRGNT